MTASITLDDNLILEGVILFAREYPDIDSTDLANMLPMILCAVEEMRDETPDLDDRDIAFGMLESFYEKD